MYKYFLLIFFLLVGCGDNSSKNGFSSLNNRDISFEADRIVEFPDVNLPKDTIDENEYKTLSENRYYSVTISENGETVIIEPGSINGTKVSKDIETIQFYELDEGTFAGGRFTIWEKNGLFEAEFTTYGSGVPVIESLRGNLY